MVVPRPITEISARIGRASALVAERIHLGETEAARLDALLVLMEEADSYLERAGIERG